MKITIFFVYDNIDMDYYNRPIDRDNHSMDYDNTGLNYYNRPMDYYNHCLDYDNHSSNYYNPLKVNFIKTISLLMYKKNINMEYSDSI